MAWRKNIAIFVVICVIAFEIIIYQRSLTLHEERFVRQPRDYCQFDRLCVAIAGLSLPR
jgi:hypothetical protein